jgi:hypothetical protein
MKAKLLFGAGIAAGYVLGSRSGRAAYDKLKGRAAGLWESKPVQDKVAAATEAVKERAPELPGQLTEAARRASTVIGSATHRDRAEHNNTHVKSAAQAAPDIESDPALNDRTGQDWSDEGGATPVGPATNVDPGKVP